MFAFELVEVKYKIEMEIEIEKEKESFFKLTENKAFRYVEIGKKMAFEFLC